MSATIKHVESGSIADRLGLQAGDVVVMINGNRIGDEIDFRFHAAEANLSFKVRRSGILKTYDFERPENEPFGISLEDFVIRPCADDCVFCFVDQNPAGLREALYFRDSDPRMSFLYGNYITATNLRDADLERIVEQRLSPMYISVHCTDDEIRRRMMGHTRQQDQLMEKMQFFRENRIEMHTQIVLVPGYNDGDALIKTIEDLYAMNDMVRSVSIVPVGLTSHRQGLENLRHVTSAEARDLVGQIEKWQGSFRSEIGAGFVYGSDELYLLAGVDFPQEEAYDGFPLMENGVGMCRDMLDEFAFQLDMLKEEAGRRPRTITMVTGALAEPLLLERIVPELNRLDNLDVRLVRAENRIFGPAVTVSGLLGYKCISSALAGADVGDVVILPPDCVNFEGDFLDNVAGKNRPDDLERELGVPVKVFAGDWTDVVS